MAQLDLDHNLARVRWQLKREDGVWVSKQPKTRRSRRQIALSPSAVVALRAHQVAQDLKRARAGRHGKITSWCSVRGSAVHCQRAMSSDRSNSC